jgi:hypothetical protein
MYKNFNTHAAAVPTQAMQKNISFLKSLIVELILNTTQASRVMMFFL